MTASARQIKRRHYARAAWSNPYMPHPFQQEGDPFDDGWDEDDDLNCTHCGGEAGVREAVIVQCYGCGEGVAEGMACRRKRGATRPPDCKASPPRDGDPDTYGVEGASK